VRAVSTAILGLPERDILDLATGYDLVEFATAVKPLLLLALLEESDQAIYLDPDTYVTAPMDELTPALAASEGGLVLTPHFLDPIPEGVGSSEGHLLTVGVYNLGFCAVDRKARPFLRWWWDHLESECLYDLLSGLFVDQKWVDVGAVVFHGSPLWHRGYNVGLVNLHERPLDLDADGYMVHGTDDRLRLFHFHSFDPHAPTELSTRPDESTAHLRRDSEALDILCKEYAEVMLRQIEWLPPAPAYCYAADTGGRPLSRSLRRVFLRARVAGQTPPSPFVAEEADQFERWRKGARRSMAKGLLSDGAKTLRMALPDEIGRLQKRFPRLASRFGSRFVEKSGIWA
jgi:hypothetical protein